MFVFVFATFIHASNASLTPRYARVSSMDL